MKWHGFVSVLLGNQCIVSDAIVALYPVCCSVVSCTSPSSCLPLKNPVKMKIYFYMSLQIYVRIINTQFVNKCSIFAVNFTRVDIVLACEYFIMVHCDLCAIIVSWVYFCIFQNGYTV